MMKVTGLLQKFGNYSNYEEENKSQLTPWTTVCADAISRDFCQYRILTEEELCQLPRRKWYSCVFVCTLLIRALALLSVGWFLIYLIGICPLCCRMLVPSRQDSFS